MGKKHSLLDLCRQEDTEGVLELLKHPEKCKHVMHMCNTCIDNMDGSLVGIYESGRALRLLLKLAFVNERPEFGIDKNWSESG